MGFKERSLPLLRNKRSNSVCKQVRKEGKQKPRKSAGKLTDSGCVPSAGRIMEKDCELKLPLVESLENNGAKMTAEEKSCFFNAVKTDRIFRRPGGICDFQSSGGSVGPLRYLAAQLGRKQMCE